MYYMSNPLSVRLNDATIARLGKHAQRVHLAPRTLAQRYVEEGLRMDEHPLIRFADGPAGRRARLVGTGKDVWEIIATVRDNDGDAAEAARYLEIPLGLVQAAISYYGAYRDEIDQWTEANEQQAAEAHAAWSAAGCCQAVRLLLDEMLSPAIARELRERGHDVLAVADHPGWVALSDPEVMILARTERRAVVTNNLRDYRPLYADAITPGSPGHFGMIFMPGTYDVPGQTPDELSPPLKRSLLNIPAMRT